jgi:hypothetical protein
VACLIIFHRSCLDRSAMPHRRVWLIFDNLNVAQGEHVMSTEATPLALSLIKTRMCSAECAASGSKRGVASLVLEGEGLGAAHVAPLQAVPFTPAPEHTSHNSQRHCCYKDGGVLVSTIKVGGRLAKRASFVLVPTRSDSCPVLR